MKLIISLAFRLFEGSSSKKIEKLKTLMCYFESVTKQSKCSDFILMSHFKFCSNAL